MEIDLSKITRLEIIDCTKELSNSGGRTVIFDNVTSEVELSLQDDERTAKLFITHRIKAIDSVKPRRLFTHDQVKKILKSFKVKHNTK